MSFHLHGNQTLLAGLISTICFMGITEYYEIDKLELKRKFFEKYT